MPLHSPLLLSEFCESCAWFMEHHPSHEAGPTQQAQEVRRSAPSSSSSSAAASSSSSSAVTSASPLSSLSVAPSSAAGAGDSVEAALQQVRSTHNLLLLRPCLFSNTTRHAAQLNRRVKARHRASGSQKPRYQRPLASAAAGSNTSSSQSTVKAAVKPKTRQSRKKKKHSVTDDDLAALLASHNNAARSRAKQQHQQQRKRPTIRVRPKASFTAARH